MDRKKTIITAVLINAGLLVVLFIAALITDEEMTQETPWIEKQEIASLEPIPFQLPVVTSVDTVSSQIEVLAAPLPEVAIEKEPMHKLPQLEQVAPKIVAAPLTPSVPVESPKAFPHFSEVVVKKGDTLEKIAKNHQVTVDSIIKMNQLPSSFLRIGQVLKVPAEKSLAASPKLKPLAPVEKTAGPEYYTVKVGDNPWTIAMRHHMKVEELLRLNALNEEMARKLKPGDRLRIR